MSISVCDAISSSSKTLISVKILDNFLKIGLKKGPR